MILKLWQKISDIGASGSETAEEKKYINLINQIILFASIFTPAFIPFLFYCGDIFYVKVQAFFSLLFPLCFLFSRIRKFTLGIISAQVLVNTNLILASTLNHNIGSEYLLFPVALISFIVFRKTSACIIGFSVSVACFFLIQVLKEFIEPVVVLQEDKRVILFQTIVLMSFIICAVIIFNFRTVISNYERSIVEQKNIIEDKNKEIIDSIRYAKRIQQASMPAERYIEKILNKFRGS
jgi:phosphoserine phosphatase RsbU/P